MLEHSTKHTINGEVIPSGFEKEENYRKQAEMALEAGDNDKATACATLAIYYLLRQDKRPMW